MKRIFPILFALVCHAWLSHAAQSVTNVNTATPNSGTGDPLFTAFNKLNTNDNYLAANYVTNLNGMLTNPMIGGISVTQTFNVTPQGSAAFGANLTTLGGNPWRGLQGFWHDTPTGNRTAEGLASFYYGYGQTRMQGAVSDSYLNPAGSASAMTDLQSSGLEVWINQPKPFLVLTTRKPGTLPSVSCTQSAVSNALMAALSGGIINFYTNNNGGLAMICEDAWVADHLDAHGGNSFGGYLMWRTNNFPMNTGNPTNLTYFCLTNGAELWLMSMAIPYVSQPANWPSTGWQETDIDATGIGSSLWEYPGGTAPGSFTDILEPAWTPDNIHKFVSQLYGWGVQGLFLQDGYGGNAENFLQISRIAASAIQNPFSYWQGGGGSATVPATLIAAQNIEQSWYNSVARRGVVKPKHGMIFGQFAGGTLEAACTGDSAGCSWPVQASLFCNSLYTESNEQSTEPAGIGNGLAFALGYLRPKVAFWTNATSFCHISPGGDSYSTFGSYTYADFKDMAGAAAVTSENVWLVGNGGTTGYEYLNSTACDAVLTNQFWFAAWQDVSGKSPIAIQIAPSNAIIAKVLSDGSTLVWLANEAQQSTNLTVTAGQLGLSSNYNMTITEVFTNLVWSNALRAAVITVPAKSSLLLRFASAPLYDPTQVGGLAYFWTYEDLPLGANQIWRDRIQGKPWEMDASASQPTNDLVNGIYFSGSTFYTNGAGFSPTAKYSTWVRFKATLNAGEPCLIGDASQQTQLALKWGTPKASVIYGGADHVTFSIATNVVYDWVYSDAGSGAASSGVSWTNAINSAQNITGTATPPTYSFLGADNLGDNFTGYIQFVAIYTNVNLAQQDIINNYQRYAQKH